MMALIKDYAEQIRGVSYKPDDLHTILNTGSITLLRANNIDDGVLNLDDVVYVDRSRVKENQKLKKGDVLICTSSGSKNLVGKAAYIPDDLDMTFGAFCKVVRPHDINTSFFQYFFQSPSYRQRISDLSAGANINNIRNEHIDEMSFHVPDIATQRRIAATLDKVSEGIALCKQMLADLDELVKSQFVEMFGDPVANNKGWPMTTLKEIAEIRIGPFGTMLHKEDYIEGGHALVNPSHIVNGQIVVDPNLTINDKKYEELASYWLYPGDVVLGRRGEMGRCAVIHEEGLLCGTGSMIIRPSEKIKPYFLQSIISSPGYRKLIEGKAVGVTMMNLNVPIVSELSFPLLPIDAQETFIAFMHQADKSKFAVQQQLAELETLKKSLMQEYFG